MRESLQRQCDIFDRNRRILKQEFRWENVYLSAVCANVFSAKGIVADPAVLQKCKQIIEGNTGLFSNFRGMAKLPMIALLAVSDDPNGKFDRAMRLYKMLKDDFSGTEYLAVAAMVLADIVAPEDAGTYIDRGRGLYGRMKTEHPFLTSSEDSVFAVLMAFSEKTDDALIAEAESCYARMKDSLGIASNAAQTLSHILALVEGSCEEKCRKVCELYDGLKERGRKYSKYFEISVLGGAAILPVSCSDMIRDILEADAFLEGQKGYGGFGIDKKTRLMHAAMLVINDYTDTVNPDNTSISAITGTLSMIAAQQAAMCAVIASSVATSAASSN